MCHISRSAAHRTSFQLKVPKMWHTFAFIFTLFLAHNWTGRKEIVSTAPPPVPFTHLVSSLTRRTFFPSHIFSTLVSPHLAPRPYGPSSNLPSQEVLMLMCEVFVIKWGTFSGGGLAAWWRSPPGHHSETANTAVSPPPPPPHHFSSPSSFCTSTTQHNLCKKKKKVLFLFFKMEKVFFFPLYPSKCVLRLALRGRTLTWAALWSNFMVRGSQQQRSCSGTLGSISVFNRTVTV